MTFAEAAKLPWVRRTCWHNKNLRVRLMSVTIINQDTSEVQFATAHKRGSDFRIGTSDFTANDWVEYVPQESGTRADRPVVEMTIREHIATEALRGWAAGRNVSPLPVDSAPANVVEACVKYANALIDALATKKATA